MRGLEHPVVRKGEFDRVESILKTYVTNGQMQVRDTECLRGFMGGNCQ
jgi:hypothetical protein